jgi:hypothetical protein
MYNSFSDDDVSGYCGGHERGSYNDFTIMKTADGEHLSINARSNEAEYFPFPVPSDGFYVGVNGALGQHIMRVAADEGGFELAFVEFLKDRDYDDGTAIRPVADFAGRIYSEGNVLHIDGTSDARLTIYNLVGQKVFYQHLKPNGFVPNFTVS